MLTNYKVVMVEIYKINNKMLMNLLQKVKCKKLIKKFKFDRIVFDVKFKGAYYR